MLPTEDGFSAPAFLAELFILLVFSADAGIGWLKVVHRFAMLEKFDEVQKIIGSATLAVVEQEGFSLALTYTCGCLPEEMLDCCTYTGAKLFAVV